MIPALLKQRRAVAEQKIVKVDARLRHIINLTTSTNRRMAANWQREQKRKLGKVACTWCGKEPCGDLWTRPGRAAFGEAPGGERCCDRCSHAPVEGWQHTHTAWDGGQYEPVCAIPMKEGDVVYMRRDGVVHFIELGEKPEPGQLEQARKVTVALLGADGGAALFASDDHAQEPVNFWQFASELPVDWLIARMAESVSRNMDRKRSIAAELAAIVADNIAKEEARQEEDKLRLAKSIERRQLEHEKKLVEDDIAKTGEPELADIDESDSDLEGDGPEAPEPEPRVNLKDPVPVKKVKGRPKRSFRQRRTRERQRAAWVTSEARSRMEVKRLERLARSRETIAPEKLVKDE